MISCHVRVSIRLIHTIDLIDMMTYRHIRLFVCIVHLKYSRNYENMKNIDSIYLYVQCCMAADVFLCVRHGPNRRQEQHKSHQPQPIQYIKPNPNLHAKMEETIICLDIFSFSRNKWKTFIGTKHFLFPPAYNYIVLIQSGRTGRNTSESQFSAEFVPMSRSK